MLLFVVIKCLLNSLREVGLFGSVYFATELVCLREHSYELSDNSMSLSVNETDDLLPVVLYLIAHYIFSLLCTLVLFSFRFACMFVCLAFCT